MAILAAAALFAPSAPIVARAATAPVVNSAQVFGDAQPSIDPVRAAELFPLSRPYGTGDFGVAYVTGNATPGTTVSITVDDGMGGQVSKSVPTATKSDPYAGTTAGDFSTTIAVTQLGVHTAGPDPNSTDQSTWGPTVLTFTLVATDSTGASSDPAVRTLTKYAGVGHDTVAPALSGMTWPPQYWCHFSGHGALTVVGPNGNCNDKQNTVPVEDLPFPDPTWAACVSYPVVGSPLQVPFVCTTDSAHSLPRGEILVSGVANDNGPAAYGVASEIANITVQVFQGDDEAPLWQQDSIFRFGARAVWGIVMNINNFEPNYPTKLPYYINVIVTDAWGNTSTATSPYFNVMPW